MTLPWPIPRRCVAVLFALLAGAISADAGARACFFAMTPVASPKLCLGSDDEIDFHTYARAFQGTFYPFEHITLGPGDALYLSDRPRLTGRLWRVGQSMDKAALIAEGIAPQSIVSAALAPVACFHADDRFQGEQSCVAPGEMEPSFARLDGKTSSIRLPPGLGARVYAEAGARGRSATLRRSIDQAGLRKLGIDDAIRSAQVARVSIRAVRIARFPTPMRTICRRNSAGRGPISRMAIHSLP